MESPEIGLHQVFMVAGQPVIPGRCPRCGDEESVWTDIEEPRTLWRIRIVDGSACLEVHGCPDPNDPDTDGDLE